VQLNLFIEKIKELRVPILACADEVARQTRAAYDKHRESAESIGAAETKMMEALGLDHLDLTSQKSYSRNFRELIAGNRFGAEYYMPCKKRVLDALAKLPHRTIAEHAPSIREVWDPAKAGRGQMVQNFDITSALEPFIDDTEPKPSGEIGSLKKRLQAGDVVISRLRSYLKEIAVVRTSDTLPAVGSSEFIVLRPRSGGISAETLMVFLRCPLAQTVLKWSQDGSNHPRFAEEDLLAIPIPDAVLSVQKKIDGLVREAIEARRESARLLDQAKRAVEDMIADDATGKRR
jgi:hypothetical protein